MSEKDLIIAENILKFIDKRGLTQAQVADYVGVKESAVSMWCHGKNIPRMDKIDRMCELFRCTRSDLLIKDHDSEQLAKDELLQQAFDTADRRILFSLSEKASDQQVKVAIKFMKTLLGEDE